MTVKEMMTADVEAISADESVVQAAQKMRDLDVGALPVRNGTEQVLGIVTDRDLIVRGIAGGDSPADLKIKKVMTQDVVTCRPEHTANEAMELMKQSQIRRLVVTDDQGDAVGILSLGDIAVECHEYKKTGEAVEAISEPAAA
ncbi:MAG TPA: CBS domain-containing protein [Tichowtungia sp.]|nr:CBS domain-containing protein [Tichowtungia sp.]